MRTVEIVFWALFCFLLLASTVGTFIMIMVKSGDWSAAAAGAGGATTMTTTTTTTTTSTAAAAAQQQVAALLAVVADQCRVELSSVAATPSNILRLSISADSRYIAYTREISDVSRVALHVASVNPATLATTIVAGVPFGENYSSTASSVQWRPVYGAGVSQLLVMRHGEVGDITIPQVGVFHFDAATGAVSRMSASAPRLTVADLAVDACWHPSGDYVCVLTSGRMLQLYSVPSGGTLMSPAPVGGVSLAGMTPSSFGLLPNNNTSCTVRFNADGTLVAIRTSTMLRVYRFDVATLAFQLVGDHTTGAFGPVSSMSWHPALTTLLATACNLEAELISVDDTTNTLSVVASFTNTAVGADAFGNSCSWSHQCNCLAVETTSGAGGGGGSSSSTMLHATQTGPSTFTLSSQSTFPTHSTFSAAMQFAPSADWLASAHNPSQSSSYLAICGPAQENSGCPPPTAVITAAATTLVGTGQSAELSGSSSYAGGDSALQYEWQLLSQPPGSLSAVSSAPTAVLTQLLLDQLGTYEVQLVVTEFGRRSPAVTLVLHAISVPPVIDLLTVAPISVLPGATTFLSLQAHDDVAVTSATYTIVEAAPPAASAAAITLPGGGGATVSVSGAPIVAPAAPGTYTLLVVVADGAGATAQQTVQFTVVEPSLPGQIVGAGRLGGRPSKDKFNFQVSNRPSLSGKIKIRFVVGRRGRKNLYSVFESQTVTLLQIVSASGQFECTGTVDGRGYYTCRVSVRDLAADNGSGSDRGSDSDYQEAEGAHDEIMLSITDESTQLVVLSTDGAFQLVRKGSITVKA